LKCAGSEAQEFAFYEAVALTQDAPTRRITGSRHGLPASCLGAAKKRASRFWLLSNTGFDPVTGATGDLSLLELVKEVILTSKPPAAGERRLNPLSNESRA